MRVGVQGLESEGWSLRVSELDLDPDGRDAARPGAHNVHFCHSTLNPTDKVTDIRVGSAPKFLVWVILRATEIFPGF